MKIWIVMLSLVAILFVGWQIWFALLIGVKEPSYNVVEKKDGYEIRKYDSYIIAQTHVTGTPEIAANKGFKILADYIFGNNTEQISMPMTAPVLVEEDKKKEQDVSFVMPFKYTLKTLPQPEDKRIKIKKKEGKLFAAYRFTWYPDDKRIERKKKKFVAMLKRDKIKMISPIILARYNPPFILPFLMRNELLVEIKKSGK